MTLISGTHLGSYEILSQLGAGGMGEVYRGMDTRLGREVALKVLPKAFVHDPERLAQFEHEARLLASLNHPNIAAIYGLDERNGIHFLILELVLGQTLAERLAAGALPIRQSLAITKQIAEALEAAHDKGIIHRDLKPANLKITPEAKVKVLDFGLAKVMVASEPARQNENTRTVGIVGTASYMSPEQVQGQVLDKRTDIWSFGCVLYEALTARKVFEGKTVSDIFAASLGRDPDWRMLPAETPRKIQDLMHRCLQKDLHRRLRDMGDARLEIEEALAALSASSSSISETALRRQIKTVYGFGPFRLDVTGGHLLRNGKAVPLTAKAFEILRVFVENNGQLLDKDTLLKTVWPDTFVEEATLAQSIFVLRKALGESGEAHRFIETVPKRGYRFVADVNEIREQRAHVLMEPPRSISESKPPEAPEKPFHNLPIQPTPLIGREKELTAVKKLLAAKELRLVTLSGTGGTGKTRLALQIATDLIQQFENGVFFISLASIINPELVASTIAQNLGVKQAAENCLIESLKEYLCGKEMLLLLDNFEQVITAAPVVSELLTACARLKVLVTSRAALNLRGEHEFSVPPLAFPDPKRLPSAEDLAKCPAVALFIERAVATHAAFHITEQNARAVAEICAQLDGLPLAIELAAARIKVLPPEALLARLQSRLKLLTGGARDLPVRQQTMRSAIDWSYELLDEDEKRLFRRLCVFAGGCTLKVAQAVVKADCKENSQQTFQTSDNRSPAPLDIDVLEGISSLLDKNLLRQECASGGEPRFRMLEIIREYGLERLKAASEVAAIMRSHANLFLELAEGPEKESLGTNQPTWLNRLEQEHDNLRAALGWFIETGDAEMGLRLGGALWRFWEMRGHLTEGRDRLAALLALPVSSSPTEARIKVLYAAGVLADAQADYSAARALFEEYLGISQNLGNKWGIANSLNNLGIIALRQQDYKTARSLYEQSLAKWRELGNKVAVALSLNNLGNVANIQGDHAEARKLHEESLAIFQELGDTRGVAWSFNHLGDVARDRRDFSEARSFYQKSLALFREVEDRRGIANSLTDLGSLARDEGDNSQARSLYDEGLKTYQQLGDRRGIARLLEGFAILTAAKGQPERSLRLAAAGATLRQGLGAPLPDAERVKLERSMQQAKVALGKAAAKAAWEEGSRMPVEKAVEYALAE